MSEVGKIVHYCWFGGREKPQAAMRYIQNWREMLRGYEIVEWNESNFDVNACRYTAEAYGAGKYAFVSDYARLHALHAHGGIYLDTDVQVLKPFDSLLTGEVVLGFEEFNYVATSTIIAPKGSRLVRVFMESYHERQFALDDGSMDLTTNVEKLTQMLVQAGLIRNGEESELSVCGERVRILEQVKFSPMDYPNGIINADATTFAVHHFGHSWASGSGLLRRKLRNGLISIFGGRNLKRLREALSGSRMP